VNRYRSSYGMGATGAQTATQITGAAAAIAGANTAAIAGTLGVAVPVIGVVIAGVVLAVTVWLNRMGPKQKRWTTQIADDATTQLADVKRAYFATPYNPANQQAAADAVNMLLEAIREGCSQTTMGEPGQRCISERLVRGGSAPWCPTGTGCDYYTEYLDPIVNDSRADNWLSAQVTAGNVHTDGTPVTLTETFTGAVANAVQSPWGPWALAAVAAFVLVQALSDQS